jgi:hypothetical protein
MIPTLAYQPVMRLSITANTDIPAFKFVDFSGNLCSNTIKSLGVSDFAALSGDLTSIITIGTAILQTSEAIARGGLVASDTTGNAKNWVAGDEVQGIAVAASEGNYVVVLLKH